MEPLSFYRSTMLVPKDTMSISHVTKFDVLIRVWMQGTKKRNGPQMFLTDTLVENWSLYTPDLSLIERM
jgi:hypothetical protein